MPSGRKRADLLLPGGMQPAAPSAGNAAFRPWPPPSFAGRAGDLSWISSAVSRCTGLRGGTQAVGRFQPEILVPQVGHWELTPVSLREWILPLAAKKQGAAAASPAARETAVSWPESHPA